MARLFSLLTLLFPALLASQQKPYDLLIGNARIVDGTGSPWYSGSIAIRGGKIVTIGPLPGAKAKKTIDARGMVVAPGFIDMLGQSDLSILVQPSLP
jgi:N-acyl-D-amino-acid deacylase